MKVTVEHIKGIRSIEFDVPGPGVYVLAGLNGCGKSTLLAALYRIRYPYAFQQFFKTSPSSNRIDPYSEASVTYEINGRSVTYRYGGQRWRATPRRNSTLFEEFPYPSIIYLEANSDRIEPFEDEIRGGRFREASQEVKDFLCAVLGDPKWRDLKYLNTRRGRGNEAYLIPYRSHQGRNRNLYYSEKSFSLGELCTLRLAQRLSNVPDESLVLIDEIEMALHPQAQVRLLERLREISAEKSLTVLFSTHSASIIKSADRSQLIGLSPNEDGRIAVTRMPYPAQLLGEVAFDDELSADFVFFVEDTEAKLLLEQLVQAYLQISALATRYHPLYKIVPVGGFKQVLEFSVSSSQIFPSYVRRIAFLDADVRDEALPAARRRNDQQMLDLFDRARRNLHFLPCTPECGIIEHIEAGSAREYLHESFAAHAVRFGRLLESNEYKALTNANPRTLAKRKLSHLVNCIEDITGIDQTQIKRKLYGAYVHHEYGENRGALQQLLGPAING
ncbi:MULTISPECIES: AAA family ATPase [Lentisalinibacter]|uniref:AAA family ATPase n=1 Tax=Lentisalinibacter TaxID=3382081 RepID=UPI00386B9519